VPDPRLDSTLPSPAEDELRALLERARRGEAAAVPALRAALDRCPQVWERYGDLAGHALGSWIELISGSDLALAEALGRKAVALKSELAGPAPTPLERLLAERVVACYFQAYRHDAFMAQAEGVSIKQAALASKLQSQAHKSYIMAIAALATIRRLLPADTSKRLSARPGEQDPANIPGDEHASGSVDAIPETEVEDRFEDLACPGPLFLFHRPGPGSN
jgi:hypothetical protein